jgi:nucleotide-binding universal stress UspA family protein
MTISSVLACVDGGEGSEKVVETAIAVGAAFSAYVEILHVERPSRPILPSVVDGGSVIASAEVFDAIEREENERTKNAKHLFQSLCVDAGLNVVDTDSAENFEGSSGGFAWRLVSGHDNRELGNRGRLFDLIILAKVDEQEGGVDSSILEAALYDTGRPVLIASNEQINIKGAPVAVAWDGSREAARSVGLALPFLEAASSVCILSVTEDDDNGTAAELGRYLTRHGVANQCVPIKKNGESIASSLIEEARNHDVGLLVMGAYGHSALSEYLFGGVTREMLESGKLPLLLAH